MNKSPQSHKVDQGLDLPLKIMSGAQPKIKHRNAEKNEEKKSLVTTSWVYPHFSVTVFEPHCLLALSVHIYVGNKF